MMLALEWQAIVQQLLGGNTLCSIASIQANLSLQSSIQMTTAEIENPQIPRLGNKSVVGGVRVGYTCAVDPV
jgi:hypothetical protein